MLVLIITVIVNLLTYLYFLTYTYAYLFLKYSELEKCRCVPQIAFRDKKFQKTSCFYTDVLKTRERSLCTSDWVPGNNEHDDLFLKYSKLEKGASTTAPLT